MKNLNPLFGKDFRLVIDRLPMVNFFCNKASIPSVSVTEINVPTPFTSMRVHGDKLEFAPLSITFNLDEDLQNYKELLRWMKSYSFPESHSQYNPNKVNPTKAYADQYSDGSIFTSTNKDNPNIEIKFTQLFPIDLGEIDLDIQSDSPEPITCTASFAYTQFEIV